MVWLLDQNPNISKKYELLFKLLHLLMTLVHSKYQRF